MSHDCQGQCRRYRLCEGDVVRVRVYEPGAGGYDWGHFWYCGVAISEDASHGLKVEVDRNYESNAGETP